MEGNNMNIASYIEQLSNHTHDMGLRHVQQFMSLEEKSDRQGRMIHEVFGRMQQSVAATRSAQENATVTL